MMDEVEVEDPKNLLEWTLQDNATAPLGWTLPLCLVQTLPFLSERSRQIFKLYHGRGQWRCLMGKLKHRP